MDSINLDTILRQALVNSMAVKLDVAILNGSGTAPEPEGILSNSSIQTVSMGDPDGATITNYDPWLDALEKLETANVNGGNASVQHPRTARALRGLKTATELMPLSLPPTVADLSFLNTTSLPIDETKGASTDASSAIVGMWSDCLVGMRAGTTIRVLSERYADNGQIGLLAFLRADVQLARPTSFCRIEGITP